MMEGKANMQFWMPSIRSSPAMKALNILFEAMAVMMDLTPTGRI